MNKNKSIWDDYLIDKEVNKLDKDINVDVLVIGGGICGVLNAYYLTQSGFNVVLVEKNRLGSGVTKNTTAFVSAQQDILYINRLKKISKDTAIKYLDANLEAIEEFKKLSYKYDFDFEINNNYIYSKENIEDLRKEKEFLKQNGIDCKLLEEEFNKLKFLNNAQMNPIKLINELSKHITYYEGTQIVHIDGNYAYTDMYKIKASQIILAMHFPYFKLKGLFSLKMYQEKSYVVSFKTSLRLKDTYTNSIKSKFYFRMYKDILIVGGNDIKTGCVKAQFDNIVEFVKKMDPKAEVIDCWTNQDCITLDDLPYIGKIDKNLYVCTGFNMWGMTSAMISALLIRDLMLGLETPYEEVFKPNRKMYKKQMFKNMVNSLKYLMKIGKNRCNHLGCKLTYIALDDSYECPCHGSKYDKNGEVLNSPANKKHKLF